MQLGANNSSQKNKVSAIRFKTEDRVLVLTCTESGVMLPIDERGQVNANNPRLSLVMEAIDPNKVEDSEEILQKRVRTLAREIINSIPLEEVTLPRPGQRAVVAAMVSMKKPAKVVRVYQTMLLRAEIEDVPNYVHVPYELLTTCGILCPAMLDIVEQLEHFECFQDFVASIADEED